MNRTIEHSAFVRRSFDDICHILRRHAPRVMEKASSDAAHRSVALVHHADEEMPNFDADEVLSMSLGQLVVEDDRHAWIEFTWDANREKRLLANVDVRLDIRRFVRRGPSPSTEITLSAVYEPAAGTRRSPEAVLFGRRVVKAALYRMLRTLADDLEEFEESFST